LTSFLKPVLIVEDSNEDFTALGRAFRKHALQNPVLRCEDGDQALDYLLGYGAHPTWPASLPAIILLDLNMPGIDGRAVLQVLKLNPKLSKIPVIIFTSSSNAKDIEECYRLGANSYITKPVNYPALEEKALLIMRYWLDATVLPMVD